MDYIEKLTIQRAGLLEKIICHRKSVGYLNSLSDSRTKSLETRIKNLDNKIDNLNHKGVDHG